MKRQSFSIFIVSSNSNNALIVVYQPITKDNPNYSSFNYLLRYLLKPINTIHQII